MILLIGGSNDGKRIDPKECNDQPIIYLRHLTLGVSKGEYFNHLSFIATEQYRRETITSGREDIHLYVHESMSPMEAFKQLIEKYPKNDKE